MAQCFLYRAWFYAKWCVRMKYLPNSAGFHVLWSTYSVYHRISYFPESAYGDGSESCIFIDYIGNRHICSYIKFALYFLHNLFAWPCFLIIFNACVYEFILGENSDCVDYGSGFFDLTHYLLTLCIWALCLKLNASLWHICNLVK